MNPRMKKMMVNERRRRSDGTYMRGYDTGWMGYHDMDYPRSERSGTYRVSPDGTRTPVYPNMIIAMPFEPEDTMIPDYPHQEPYMPMRGNYRTEPRSRRPMREDSRYDRPMNRIGFAQPEEFKKERYSSRADMPNVIDMGYSRSEKTSGYANGMEDDPLTKEEAMAWVSEMKNADGSTGPHWTMEQARQIMDQQRIQCDEIEFFVALNMMYSDYCKVAKKYNCSTMEFYAMMAKAFLEDKDAQPEKLARYYDYIVKH